MPEEPKRCRAGNPKPRRMQQIDLAEIADLTFTTCFGNRRGIPQLGSIDPDDTFL